MASITFSGNINQEIIDRKKQELIKWLKEKNITTIGSAELARYNPPFVPGFLKRNEVLIEVNYPLGLLNRTYRPLCNRRSSSLLLFQLQFQIFSCLVYAFIINILFS
jgi:hypothetical protein